MCEGVWLHRNVANPVSARADGQLVRNPRAATDIVLPIASEDDSGAGIVLDVLHRRQIVDNFIEAILP